MKHISVFQILDYNEWYGIAQSVIMVTSSTQPGSAAPHPRATNLLFAMCHTHKLFKGKFPNFL